MFIYVYNLKSHSFPYTQENTKRKSGMPEVYTQLTEFFEVHVFMMSSLMHNWKDACPNMSFPQNIWTG